VQQGLTLKGALWAWTYGLIGHWHPLTWLTHMTDCQMYGLWAGGHHLTNVALHAAASVLLFLALRSMTGALWRSAFVAAVFAVHPLRAESVAWISERKDVLSGVFFMLTLWAYIDYTRRPSRGRGVAVVLLYGLGLLSKDMLVTLPLLLLLLDWWPLRRMKGAVGATAGLQNPGIPFWGLVREKVPLFVLSFGSCLATALVPEKIGNLPRLPLALRAGNALVSYVAYLRQLFCPYKLAIPYLYPPGGTPAWKAGLAFVLLAGVTAAVLASRRKRPYLLVGWFWYLGMLVPVIGMVQISYYTRADRYTYLPGIGICLAVTWLIAEWRAPRALLGSLMAAALAVLMVCAWKQAAYWRNSETLWGHTLDCLPDNYIAEDNLGEALVEKKSLDTAMAHYEKALQLKSDFVEAHYNLGICLRRQGRMEEAMAEFQRAAQLNPHTADAFYNIGEMLQQNGQLDEAIAQYRKVLEINPSDGPAHGKLGMALAQRGRLDEAIIQLQEALRLDPENVDACNGLGYALVQEGSLEEAIRQFQQAVRIKPDREDIQNNLGIAYFQRGLIEEAITQYRKALALKPDDAKAHNNLGNALRQEGKENEALSQFESALQLNPQDPSFLINLASLLATASKESLRDGTRAVELAQRANALTRGKNVDAAETLAAALAEAGRFKEAVDAAQTAFMLAKEQSNTGKAQRLQSDLKLYQAGKKLSDQAGAGVGLKE